MCLVSLEEGRLEMQREKTVGTDADSGVVHPCGRERQGLLRYPQKLREVGTIPLQSFQKEPSVMTP